MSRINIESSRGTIDLRPVMGRLGPQGPQGADSTVPGPQGAQGLTGPQGLPGTGAVPADEAVAGYIGTAGTSASKTAAEVLSRRVARGVAGSSRPSLVHGATVTVAGASTLPVDIVNGILYGAAGTSLRKSTDDGGSWTVVATLPYEPQRLLATDDGEVLFINNNRLYKSSGWTADPATATWTLKKTANGSCAFYRFSIDGDGTKFIASEYSGTRADSRYVHVSTDSGDTWTTVWDTVAQYPATHAESHVHGCCYDPWADRFWFTEGHGTPKGFYYSDDDGATWVRLTGGYADSLLAMPTVLVATDDGIVLGTDDGPNGIMGIRRDGTANPTVEVVWQRYEQRPDAFGFAERGFRDPATGLVYMGFRSEYADARPYIAAGTATSGGLVWDSNLAGASARVVALVVTPSGKLLATYYPDGTTLNLLSATVGVPGSPVTNRGNLLDGVARDGTATAGGLGSAASGLNSAAYGRGAAASASQATALGAISQAVGNGTATGYDARATGADKSTATGGVSRATGARATADGYDAQATGSDTTALGQASRATGTNATAGGSGATAGGNGTAFGKGANATSADKAAAFGTLASATGVRALALGNDTSVTHTDAVGLGASTVSTAHYQVQIGGRHIELEEAAEPTAPAANKARWYVKDNGSGKTQLCVRFNTGAVQVIATEP